MEVLDKNRLNQDLVVFVNFSKVVELFAHRLNPKLIASRCEGEKMKKPGEEDEEERGRKRRKMGEKKKKNLEKKRRKN